MPNLYIIGGANGSGKTTAAMQILPYFLEVFEYVNADEIAAGLSPFNPESVAVQAGGLMLARLETLVNANTDFAFETTLAARNFARFLRAILSIPQYSHLKHLTSVPWTMKLGDHFLVLCLKPIF
ncbi:hypothetical protein [Sphaerospermopsis sp. FACHB-1094]|uniref:hypothetical protein n=1 Tax=Sphaerospermopsis sp. FACHB-1094 TaxID=2692861 RepID=UPI001F54FC83|nr:hypothetical protein [Sphaerospermopsis sp. FACHB-1094]